jgi:hypothetical protein
MVAPDVARRDGCPDPGQPREWSGVGEPPFPLRLRRDGPRAPGQRIEFTVQNHLSISSYAVWNH